MKTRNAAPVLLAIALGAAVSRTPLTALGVLQGAIREELGLSYGAMGLLTTIPVIMYIFSALGIGRLKVRFGLAPVLGGGLAVLSAGLFLRSWGGTWGLFLGMAGVGVGISALNVLIPAAAKEYFPRRVGAVSGFYTVCVYLATAAAAAIAVPMYRGTGSWRLALGAWLPFAVAGAAAWLLLRKRGSGAAPGARVDWKEVLRRPVTWLLILMMGSQSVIFYGMTAWLPAMMASHGFSAELAGRSASLFQLGGILGALICGAALSGLKRQSGFCFLIGAGFFVGTLLLAAGGSGAALWAACILIGASSSASFSVINCIAALRAGDPEETAAMVALVQTAGYPFGAAAPVLLGRLFDRTASWLPALAILAAAGAIYALAGVKAGDDGK